MDKSIIKTSLIFLMSTVLFACGGGVTTTQPPQSATTTTVKNGTVVSTSDLVALGQLLYNDENLSVPAGQSCASCHTPTVAIGFDDPDDGDPSSLGADGGSFGERNSPTTSYAAHIPAGTLVIENIGGVDRQIQFGGQFLDGRAVTLEDQAKLPFLNPVEMGNLTSLDVINKINNANYLDDFETLFGIGSLNDADTAFDYVADAIAAFERSDLFSPFSAKFDQVANNTATFTASEMRGQRLFNGRGQCDTCHQSPAGSEEVFSDFTYKNIGVPRNPILLANIGNATFIDNGLGDVSGNRLDDGRFRVSSLRNISVTPPYMHNGIFKTLTEVVEFYNTRDITFTQAPEVNRNLFQGGQIGELGLSDTDIQDLVAFLETLTDQ